jgi:hypothetical protein
LSGSDGNEQKASPNSSVLKEVYELDLERWASRREPERMGNEGRGYKEKE